MRRLIKNLSFVIMILITVQTFCLATTKVILPGRITDPNKLGDSTILSPNKLEEYSPSVLEVKLNGSVISPNGNMRVTGGTTLSLSAYINKDELPNVGIFQAALGSSEESLVKTSLTIANNGIDNESITIPSTLADGTYDFTILALTDNLYHTISPGTVAMSNGGSSTNSHTASGMIQFSFTITKYTPIADTATAVATYHGAKLSSTAKEVILGDSIAATVSPTSGVTRVRFKFGSASYKAFTNGGSFVIPTTLVDGKTYTLTIFADFSDATTKTFTYKVKAKAPVKDADNATATVKVGTKEVPINGSVDTFGSEEISVVVSPTTNGAILLTSGTEEVKKGAVNLLEVGSSIKVSATPSESVSSIKYHFDSDKDATATNNKTITVPATYVADSEHTLTVAVVYTDATTLTGQYTLKIKSKEEPVVEKEKIEEPIPVPTVPSLPMDEDKPEVSGWAKEEVEAADNDDLIPASIKGKKYTKDITRLEFAAIALRTYEKLTNTTVVADNYNPFVDTNDDEVLRAYKIGITIGTSETTFSPDINITREQMATMMSRALLAAGIDVKVDLNRLSKFSDHVDISEYALQPVYYMANIGIIKGVGNNRFDSIGNATIEQSLLISERIYNEFKK